MLKAGGRVQGSSDQQVINEAARRRSVKKAAEPRAALPAVLAAVGLLGAFAWWRHRNNKGNKGHAGKSSTQKARQDKVFSSKAGTSGLPRNKTSNNKKNKDRRKNERERRAEKREKEGGSSGQSDPHHDEEKDNTIILTSKFVDTTPKTASILPKAQRMGPPGGTKAGLDPAVAEALSRKS